MKYMLLIYNDPTAFDPAPDAERCTREYMAFTQEILEQRRDGRRRRAPERPRPRRASGCRDGKTHHDRRPVRRDEGSPRRLLHRRREGPRPGHSSSRRRSRTPAPAPSRCARSGSSADRDDVTYRAPVPARVGAGARVADPRRSATSTLAEDALQEATRRRARAVAASTACPIAPARGCSRPRGARPIDRIRREAQARRASTRPRTSCSTTAEDEEPDMNDDHRRPAAADLHVLPPGARHRRAGRAHAAHARRPHAPTRSRAPSSCPTSTMAQRLVRAKTQDQGRRASPTGCRDDHELPDRLDGRARGPLPHLQRGLHGDGGRRARAPRAVRRGHPAGRGCWSS